jgi:hypothetical protein
LEPASNKLTRIVHIGCIDENSDTFETVHGHRIKYAVVRVRGGGIDDAAITPGGVVGINDLDHG